MTYFNEALLFRFGIRICLDDGDGSGGGDGSDGGDGEGASGDPGAAGSSAVGDPSPANLPAAASPGSDGRLNVRSRKRDQRRACPGSDFRPTITKRYLMRCA